MAIETMKTKHCFVCQKHTNLNQVTGNPIVETDEFLATHYPVLDGVPAIKGHILIEPKRHIFDFPDMNKSELQNFGTLLSNLSWALKETLKAEHVYVFRLNDQVEHLHIHLVPRFSGTPKEFFGLKLFEWSAIEKINLKEILELSKKLREKINLYEKNRL